MPRDHRESDEAFHHRRRWWPRSSVAGAGLLGLSLSPEPDSKAFYGLTLAVAATWLLGGLAVRAAAPGHSAGATGRPAALRRRSSPRSSLGVGAFGAFYGCRPGGPADPVLDRGAHDRAGFAEHGRPATCSLTTLVNGAAEEVFFRGALYAAFGERHQLLRSTAATR